MLRIFYFVICLFTFLFIGLFGVSAQTATKSATKSADDKISELKERIATQVSKLKIIQKRGVLGTISDLSNNQIILNGENGNKRFVDVDELTKFEDLAGRQIGISDLKKGLTITVVGLYNTESRRILARFIKTRVKPKRIKGEVIDLDKKNFIIEVLDPSFADSVLVNVENTTKTNELVKDNQIVKSGFSKILVGGKILVVGTDDQRVTAKRILHLPSFSPTP